MELVSFINHKLFFFSPRANIAKDEKRKRRKSELGWKYKVINQVGSSQACWCFPIEDAAAEALLLWWEFIAIIQEADADWRNL